MVTPSTSSSALAKIHELGDPFGLGIVEDGGIYIDPETGCLDPADGGNRAGKCTVQIDRLVVLGFKPVEVNREGQEFGRFEKIEFLFEQQRIGAQIYVFFAFDEFLDDLAHFLVQQWFATGNRDHRRAAFLDRLDTFGDRHAAVQNFVGIIDLAAAGAGEVAAEQGLQHQDQGIAVLSFQTLLEYVAADGNRLTYWNTHGIDLSNRCADCIKCR